MKSLTLKILNFGSQTYSKVSNSFKNMTSLNLLKTFWQGHLHSHLSNLANKSLMNLNQAARKYSSLKKTEMNLFSFILISFLKNNAKHKLCHSREASIDSLTKTCSKICIVQMSLNSMSAVQKFLISESFKK